MAKDKFAVPQDAIRDGPSSPPTSHHPTTPHAHEGDGDHSYVCKRTESGWVCEQFYKRQLLQDVIDSYNGDGRAIIDKLKDFGITVYLVEQGSVNRDVLLNVIEHASTVHNDRSKQDYENQRCFLYRDDKGRLYNLTLQNESDERASLRPGYLSLLLGLVLQEEIGLVWLNVSMFLRGLPSVSAYTFVSMFESDWPRKLAVLSLAGAAVQTPGSDLQTYGTIAAVLYAMSLLAANLGARAWYFMKCRPILQKESFFAPILAYFVAMVTGIFFPYLGFGQIQAGGKAAVSLVIFNSIIVASMFVVSDLDVVQKIIVVGSETCNQDTTNVALGAWFTLTVITCLVAAYKIEPLTPHPEDDDSILVEDHTSIVGLKVANFPDYPIPPNLIGKAGSLNCETKTYVGVGVLVSIMVGVGVVLTGFYDEYADHANDFVENTLGGSAKSMVGWTFGN
ncbi:predicted protein [Thalassiosira pseudonana CCMP1335]|uniref:Uncharacterized protein n=1 Tax=Thalassiosira pseudonana TaxID=35128 RepID=B8CFY0_THAPS|nr:predicted protein [Thalassiosira pseudonana CCMP1335]EED87711.1 predicted protein [Thalassiosira pseudonana CCMP1335]